eukprot:3633322-Rhodomonas_salina.4
MSSPSAPPPPNVTEHACCAPYRPISSSTHGAELSHPGVSDSEAAQMILGGQVHLAGAVST